MQTDRGLSTEVLGRIDNWKISDGHLMSHRFFLPDLSETGAAILEGLEAHHLINVLRSRSGDVVELFNGTGLVAQAEIVATTKKSVELKILESRRMTPSSRRVILGTAVPKGDRFDWLIEKSTELGVTKLVPLVTTRSIVDPRAGKLDKLRQTVISACKQSGRNHLMELSPVTTWPDFVARELSGQTGFIAHPGPQSLPMTSDLLHGLTSVVFAVGPEGGFTDEEISLAVEHGARPVSLGPHILRIETAALALAARAL